jgi:cobalt-zinc-cadmium efflux system outer membrane protein
MRLPEVDMIFNFPLRNMAAPLLTMVLGGCATFSADGGFDSVSQTAQERLAQTTNWSRSTSAADSAVQEVRALLSTPLSPEAAVHIALINNRTLQAAYSELGIAEAELVQAGRLPNPGFSYGRTHSGDDLKIERSLSMSVMRLLTMPATAQIDRSRFRQTRLRLTGQMLHTAALTRKSYYQAIAAAQSAHYQEQVQQAAAIALELTTRMAARGNLSTLDAAREQAFSFDTDAQLTRARLRALEARENLLRLLGLEQDDGRLQLPPRLPALPSQAASLAQLEQRALQQRLDVQAAREQLTALQQSLGLSRSTRFVNVLDLGYVRNSESNKNAEIGYQVSLEIPLFDWGQARVAKAEALYMQAAHQLAASAIQASSEVRLAYATQQQSYRLARQYEEVLLPLRKRIAEETLLRYNGMLVSVFDLLTDAREQAGAVNATIDAARDFWLADCDLQLALGGSLAWSTQQQNRPATPASTQGHAHE